MSIGSITVFFFCLVCSIHSMAPRTWFPKHLSKSSNSLSHLKEKGDMTTNDTLYEMIAYEPFHLLPPRQYYGVQASFRLTHILIRGPTTHVRPSLYSLIYSIRKVMSKPWWHSPNNAHFFYHQGPRRMWQLWQKYEILKNSTMDHFKGNQGK